MLLFQLLPVTVALRMSYSRNRNWDGGFSPLLKPGWNHRLGQWASFGTETITETEFWLVSTFNTVCVMLLVWKVISQMFKHSAMTSAHTKTVRHISWADLFFEKRHDCQNMWTVFLEQSLSCCTDKETLHQNVLTEICRTKANNIKLTQIQLPFVYGQELMRSALTG